MNIEIIYKGIRFDVGFDYQPEEKEVRYYSDGTGYPGCPASIENIYEITHNGTDFMGFFEDDMEGIDEAIWDAMAG